MQSMGVYAAVPRTRSAIAFAFPNAEFWPERNVTISGVTTDSSGIPLGVCVVKLFNTATDTVVTQSTSDALGNYTFTVDKTQFYYIVSYKAGVADVYGTSLNSLRGV